MGRLSLFFAQLMQHFFISVVQQGTVAKEEIENIYIYEKGKSYVTFRLASVSVK